MFKNFDPSKPYFYGVALFLILAGAGITAVGAVEWGLNYWADYEFAHAFLKAVAGVAVLALGYIQIELEMLRIQMGGKR